MLDTNQNEKLEMFADAMQQEIVSETHHCSFFSLKVDGTTDIKAYEQFS